MLREDAWEDAVIAVGSCSHVYPMFKFNTDRLLCLECSNKTI